MARKKRKDNIKDSYFCVINLKKHKSDGAHKPKGGDQPEGDDKPEGDGQPVLLTQAELNNLTRTFQRSLLSYWVIISKRNICYNQKQRSTCNETLREN